MKGKANPKMYDKSFRKAVKYDAKLRFAICGGRRAESTWYDRPHEMSGRPRNDGDERFLTNNRTFEVMVSLLR